MVNQCVFDFTFILQKKYCFEPQHIQKFLKKTLNFILKLKKKEKMESSYKKYIEI